MTAEDKRRRDLADLRRHTLIWIGALVWIGAGYALQDPARDPYDAAQRTAFSYAMLVVIPVITAIFVYTWIGTLRQQAAPGGPGAARTEERREETS